MVVQALLAVEAADLRVLKAKVAAIPLRAFDRALPSELTRLVTEPVALELLEESLADKNPSELESEESLC